MLLKEISLFNTMEIVLNQYRSLEEHLLYAGWETTLLSEQHNMARQSECMIVSERL